MQLVYAESPQVISAMKKYDSGTAPDIGIFMRSRWEKNYSRFLKWQKIRFEYEPAEFFFEKIKRGTRSYKPDFWLPDKKEWHEVKGYMDPRSTTKLKRMAKYYPEEKIVIVGKEFFQDIERKGICRLIPNWECKHNEK